MNYELRHDNDIVMVLDIGYQYYVDKVVQIVNNAKIPVGIGERGPITAREVDEWLMDRGIPAKREDIEYILEKENTESVNELLIKNNCMGLKDHYWLIEEGSPVRWEDINYFENKERFGKWGDEIYLGRKIEEVADGKTPSSSASGMQPKMWVIRNNDERWLVKGSEEMTKQEPLSEYAASLILDKMDIKHVEYILLQDKNDLLSGCKNMLQNHEELISAYYMTRDKKSNNESHLEHYVRKCADMGLDRNDVRAEMEKMIVVDYLFANTDRHWSNFSIIRSADTLQGIKLAPLYDHGAAFFTKVQYYKDIGSVNRNLKCKSFKGFQESNLDHVKNIDWLKRDALREIPDIVRDAMHQNKGREERVNEITRNIISRITMFKKRYGLG